MTAERQPGVLLWHHSNDVMFLEAERRRASGWQADNLRKDFAPATVIDVGSAGGTAGLQEAFPDAHHVLIDAVKEHEPGMQGLANHLGGEYLIVAIGDQEGTATIHVDPERLWGSSILPTIDPWPGEFEQRTVPMRTLDSLAAERGWAPPYGLKVDTEGFEDRVIQGSTSLLEQTEFVIAEVSVARRFEASYSFADFIDLMKQHGFVACDVLDGLKNWQNGHVVFVDMIFRPDA